MNTAQDVSPQLGPWLEQFNGLLARLQAAGYKATAIGAREALAGLTAQFVPPGPAVAWVNDELIDGDDYAVPVRIYHPQPEAALPVLLYLHGGGHTAGSVSVYDPICRRLAEACRHVVVSVEYRLAPENPYPAGVLDACAAARGVFAALERRGLAFERRLSIGGDSAGAALSASVCGLLQEEIALHRQVLIYPSVDYTMSFPSMEANGSGYFLNTSRIAWYFDNYFQHGEDRAAASPLNMPVSAAMPATLLVSAGFDPLRDEAFAYERKLREAGAACEHLHLPDMIHAFLNMESMVPDACRQTYRRIGDFLKA
ncbi:alpha/beta hydrolase [uncultured Aquitalea sp.]|uniref:alpha/beta hydrolase n=1 Tax=uncultured Aquitalea sp. TaxID=540272 RepID=UPI0025DE5568|nr:alpha/beta hydrolase [uncultured Aquitalea sp.]